MSKYLYSWGSGNKDSLEGNSSVSRIIIYQTKVYIVLTS